MKAMLVGLGKAGYNWYNRLKGLNMLGVVVETDEQMKEKMGEDNFPFYTSIEEALQQEDVDFVVNVTSPSAHTVINYAAMDRKLPILCEKPISFDYEESIEVVKRAKRENIPFMIAENYRRFPHVRQMKALLEQGAIGEISTIDLSMYRYFHVPRPYPVHILRDIGVHHLDMIRYITGSEASSIHAQLYRPISGWDEPEALMNANVFMEMASGVMVSYNSSIATHGLQTSWTGSWRIAGKEGALEMVNNEIYVVRDGRVQKYDDFSQVHAPDALEAFLTTWAEGGKFETSGEDYLKTEALIHFAEQSSNSGRSCEVELPGI